MFVWMKNLQNYIIVTISNGVRKTAVWNGGRDSYLIWNSSREGTVALHTTVSNRNKSGPLSKIHNLFI
jgi:hypothetical protein